MALQYHGTPQQLFWQGSPRDIVFDEQSIQEKLAQTDKPCYVMRDFNGRIGVSNTGALVAEGRGLQVLAMANPTPEIMPDDAHAGGAAVVGTGRSDFPNQVNNVLCFPFLFRGALDVGATEINGAMQAAAVEAVAQALVPLQELMPAHFTSALATDGAPVSAAPAINMAAAAVATVAPIVFF